jgi:hypothetical protein
LQPPATSPLRPAAWPRAPLALVHRGLPAQLEGKCGLERMENIKYANNLASDAFTKRETAAEELYIRQEEKAKYVHEPLANASIPASFTFPTKEQMGNW